MARHRSPRGRQNEGTSVLDDRSALPGTRVQDTGELPLRPDAGWIPAPRRPTHSGAFDAEPLDRPGIDLAELDSRDIFEPTGDDAGAPKKETEVLAQTSAGRRARSRRARHSRRTRAAARPGTRSMIIVAGAVVALVAGATVLVGLGNNATPGDSTSRTPPLAQPAPAPNTAPDGLSAPAPKAAPPNANQNPAKATQDGATKYPAKKPAGSGGATSDLSTLEARSGEKIELTGYSFQDNQGGDNAKISCPIIHQEAGGTGTFQDPITVASGGSNGGASADGVKCGDRFYLPSVKRYVIVEDTGNTPNSSMPHLDMYVANDPNKSCMDSISGTVTAIPHPPQGLPVLAGPIGGKGGCLLPGSG